MGWLNTLLDITAVGMQAAQLNKLDQLRQQGAEGQVVQVILLGLRDEIFKYNQAAHDIVEIGKENPKMAAGAMRILDQRLRAVGITSDLFPDISDKEYVAQTQRFIRDSGIRLSASLTPEDQTELEAVATDVLRLPHYAYFIEKYQDVRDYREALPVYTRLKSRNSGCLFVLVLGVVWASVFSVIAGTAAIISGTISGAEAGVIALFSWGSLLGLVFATLAAIGAAILLQTKYLHQKEYRTSREVVERVSKEVDLDRFAELEDQLGTDFHKITKLQQQAIERIQAFFGGEDFARFLPSE